MFCALRVNCNINSLHNTKRFVIYVSQRSYKSLYGTCYIQPGIVQTKLHIQPSHSFRTTQKLDVPPFIALLLKPIVRVGAIIFGRGLRKWWSRKPESERDVYKQWFTKNRNTFFGSISLLSVIIVLFYILHIETDPLTGRSQFILFNKQQQAELDKIILQVHLDLYKGQILSHNHVAHQKLKKIIDTLLTANKDIPAIRAKQWTLTVIDSPLNNAYVLLGGHLFVFVGTLDQVENDDQLAIILAHEIAHEILQHSLEQLSTGVLWDLLIILPLILLWACFPNMVAFFTQVIAQQFVDLTHTLPYHRALEYEADDVGLNLAAAACVDVREAVVFWGIMRTLVELEINPQEFPLLSTHPAHGDREGRLNELLPKSIELRTHAGCPNLSDTDPRKVFYSRTLEEHKMYFKRRGIIES